MATGSFPASGYSPSNSPTWNAPPAYGFGNSSSSLAKPRAPKRSTPESKAHDNKLGTTLAISGLVVTVLAIPVVIGSGLPPILAFLVWLAGESMLITGLCFFARAKGYHPAMGLL